jgi:hypothetical protein
VNLMRVHEQNGNVVADRIHCRALIAGQGVLRGPVFEAALTLWAAENIEQFLFEHDYSFVV